MEYRLYYSQFCFFCQKVLMPLRGRQHDIELVSVGDSDHRRELIQGGGKGQVPCLRIENEDGSVQWMYESNDILSYIKQQGLLS